MTNEWKNQYKKMLYDIDVTIQDISKYIDKKRPKYLYKYRSFNSYWKNILFDGLVFFPDSSTLNDPFDCHIYVDTKKFSSFVNSFASKYVFPWIPLRDIEKEYNSRIKNNLDWQYEYTRKQILLTCFSENVNSILMWAHYADSHKGFCIEYDTEKMDTEYKQFLFPVIYQEEVYDYTEIAIMNDLSYINYMKTIKMMGIETEYELKDVSNNIYIPLLMKAQEWSYEQEWRIVVPSLIFGTNEHLINMGNAINSIYLGVNCYENSVDVNEIINWAKERKVNVYKMHKDTGKYELISNVILKSE